ncbi:MAG: hypothetical protein V1881_01015 [Candidatus Micrarchaeota archaeon]
MEITKQKLVVGFTVFIILAFVLEAFVVVMWKPDEQATPTPSPQAQSFGGSGLARAQIVSLGSMARTYCDSNDDVSGLLKGVEGISSVYPSGKLYGLMLSNASEAIDARIRTALAGKCEPLTLRYVRVQFLEKLTVKSDNESGKTLNLTVNGLQDLQNDPNVQPMAYASRGLNETVVMNVSVQITAQGPVVTMMEAEPPAGAQAYEGGGFGAARIAKLEDVLWVLCNATNATALLSGIEGVNTTDAVEENRSYNVAADAGANTTALAEKIAGTLAGACDVRVMRYAMLSFTDDVSVTSESNETRVLPKAKLEGAYGMVRIGRAENETILASVMVQMLGNEIAGTAIQDAG